MFSISSQFSTLVLSRLFIGISIGGEYTAIFTTVDEFMPAQYRGRVDIILDSTWHLGSLIAYGFNYLLPYSQYKWRCMFIFGSLCALPLLFLRSYIPESPRWLIFIRQYRQAHQVVQSIKYINQHYQNNNDNHNDDEQIQLKSDEDNEYEDETQIPCINQSMYWELIIRMIQDYPRRIILGLSIMIAQSFFYNGVFYSYGQVLSKIHNIPQDQLGFFMLPISIGSLAGPILFAKYFDHYGRRFMMFSTYFLAGFFAILQAYFILYPIPLFYQSLLWILVFLVASPAASSAHLTISEIFPIHFRLHAVAFFFSISLFIGALSPYIFSLLIINSQNVAFAYFLAAFFMILASFVVYFLAIDAENQPLELLT